MRCWTPAVQEEKAKMSRKLVIAVITAVAAILETAADACGGPSHDTDAIAATLPPPAADGPRLRVVASGRLCLRLLIVSPPVPVSAPRRQVSDSSVTSDTPYQRARPGPDVTIPSDGPRGPSLRARD